MDKDEQDPEIIDQESELIASLLRALSVVEEPRKARGKRHSLSNVLVIAVLGFVCGCDSAEALEDWGHKEAEWLSKFLDLTHGTPSQDVYLRVFAAMDSKQFQSAFWSWARQLLAGIGIGKQIAIDGQTNRGSRSRSAKKSPIHMVSALLCGEGLVIAQVKTDEKSNEITAIPKLLGLLDLREALVSMDAMGTQVSIAKLIKAGSGDYLMGLKDNQASLRTETESTFEAAESPREANIDIAEPPAIQSATQVNKGHGRLETRTAIVMKYSKDWVPSGERWSGLSTLIAIDSIREDLISGKTSTERRYYISSRPMNPTNALQAIRSHWHVENKLHWCLDVTFGQDGNQTRTDNAAENLAVVRHFALNIVRQYTGDRYSMPRRRRLCDYRIEYREAVLGLVASK